MDSVSSSFIKKAQIVSNLKGETSLSPHLAAKKCEEGDYRESVEFLERYTEKFQSNTVALIFLSKCYAQQGKYHQAVQILKSACQSIHSSITFDYYLKQIEECQRNEIWGIKNKNISAFDLKISAESNGNDLVQVDENKTYEQFLVSETLAKIYIAQGELKEAINIYEKLIESKPEDKMKYLQAIEELKSHLEN